MSVFVTNGPLAFWLAIVAIALCAWVTELRFGAIRQLADRRGLLGNSSGYAALWWVLLGSLHFAGDAVARMLYIARDVGPSAGDVGVSVTCWLRWVAGRGRSRSELAS